jgi:hypothetical protein
MLPALSLVIFQIGSHAFAWGQPWTAILLLIASCVARIIGMHHHTQLVKIRSC